eukprot:TRINITY_DN2303_c0_g1_i1.p2 TRINITY_DN2303_c0_g1~~TRINITY_DN2303_c0_g1_i1.p2  ORF type:complete len:121 (+),score=31.79 TRINITY_DN2303_c0_g1_i1:184-546(+)
MAAVTCSAATVAVVAAPSSSFVQKSAVSQRVAMMAPRKCAKLVANRSRTVMSAEKQNLVLPATVALLAAAVLPEIAEAAQPGISPSLQNLLYSVLAGGVVLGGLAIAVAGVSTFDPVKRK